MITSKNNEYIKYVKSLSLKKNRDVSGEFIIEGIKIVKEAIEEKMIIHKVIICDELFHDSFDISKDVNEEQIMLVSNDVFLSISDTKTPQGIIAVVQKKSEEITKAGDVIFALDHIQDPGNLGTIIRTLDATGIQTLFLSEGCADEYNSKVIRSTMGAIFRVNILDNMNLEAMLREWQGKGYQIIVTALDANSGLFEYSFPKKCIIVIGNESNGVSKEIQQIADIKIKIPMVGKTESLNAGVAASLMAYECLRKR